MVPALHTEPKPKVDGVHATSWPLNPFVQASQFGTLNFIEKISILKASILSKTSLLPERGLWLKALYLNATKSQSTRSTIHPSPTFKDVSVPLNNHLELLGVDLIQPQLWSLHRTLNKSWCHKLGTFTRAGNMSHRNSF